MYARACVRDRASAGKVFATKGSNFARHCSLYGPQVCIHQLQIHFLCFSSSITIPSERTTGVDATGEGTVVATGEQSVPSPTPPPPELLSVASPVPDTMRSSLSPLALPFAPSSGYMLYNVNNCTIAVSKA